ncbi:zf-TFIIB domain-containing protein [Actinosynnema sp. NPDC002837]
MICPKCQDLMRTISRGSVHIEQCENCKGVFLDGGELEQIIAAERAHYAQPYRPEGVPVSVPVPVPVSAPAAEPTAVVPIEGTLPADGDVPVEGGQQPAAVPPAPAAGPPPPYQPPPGTPTGPPPPYQPPPGTAPAVPPPAAYPGGYYAPQPHYPRRKRSFLEELLD